MPIAYGEPPEPLPVEWVALSRLAEPNARDGAWCLYLLAANGRIVESLQWDTERIAPDQAPPSLSWNRENGASAPPPSPIPSNRFRVFYEFVREPREVWILAIGVKDRDRQLIAGEELDP